MKKGFTKIAVSAVLGLAVMLPALANTTTITMTATVADFLSVQVVKSDDKTIVSKDDSNTQLILTNLVLDFGTVDARGIAGTSVTPTNGGTTGITLSKVIVGNTNTKIYNTATPPAQAEGAIYFVNSVANTSGYSVVTNTAGGATVDVAVGHTGTAIRSFVTKNDIPVPAAGATGATLTASDYILADGESQPLASDNTNNALIPVTVGLFVENSTAAAAASATLTFTGTPHI